MSERSLAAKGWYSKGKGKGKKAVEKEKAKEKKKAREKEKEKEQVKDMEVEKDSIIKISITTGTTGVSRVPTGRTQRTRRITGTPSAMMIHGVPGVAPRPARLQRKKRSLKKKEEISAR